LIEQAYHVGEQLGLAVWCQDEAGPFKTEPYPAGSWTEEGHPVRQPHEHLRNGTAKLLTLFHPATGAVRVKGTTSSANAVLHPWLKAELAQIVAALPAPQAMLAPEENRRLWEQWQAGLTVRITLPDDPPPLRMLLIWDNLAGHYTGALVRWLFQHGIMPLYTPLSGSWLNMAESIQRILKRRAVDGQHPQAPEEIMAWLEATARGWNAQPTPFVWGGKRATRRARSRARRHALGGSGACTRRAVRRKTTIEKWRCAKQVTH
jgi:transposase